MDLPEGYNGNQKHRHSLISEYLIYKGQNSMGAWPMPGRELGQIPLPVSPGEGGVSTHPSCLLTMDVVAGGSGKGIGMWGKRCVLENSTSSQMACHGHIFQSLESRNQNWIRNLALLQFLYLLSGT